MEHKFKFDIDDAVTTVFKETGIIDMAAIDNRGFECYFVKTKSRDAWYKVDQLEKCKDVESI
jgi:hypothetical protein